MEKQIISYHPTDNSGLLELIDPFVLEKTAGIADDITKFLETFSPQREKTYALINALSSGQHYSSNLNGDWFDEDQLIKYHKTFEALGHIYRLHQNKDPKKSLGKVVFSYYNPKMHRVELIVEFDNTRAKDIIERAQNGEAIATSMGTRVSYEKCSICNHISKVLRDRCDHLKYEMNKIYPDGRKVFAYNYMPKFFDISIVRIGADKTSRIVKLIAIDKQGNKKIIIFNKKLASNEKISYNKIASLETVAEINKQVPAKIEVVEDKGSLKEITDLVKQRLDKKVLYKLSEYPLKDTMSTLLALKIMPAPEDFQKLALCSFNLPELAEKLEKENIVFNLDVPDEIMVMDEVKLANLNKDIANILESEIPLQSNLEIWNLSRALIKVARYFPDGTWYQDKPKPEDRSILNKVFVSEPDTPALSVVKNPIVPLGVLGYLYYGYAKTFKDANPTKFKRLLAENPWLIPVVVGGAAFAVANQQKKDFKKEAGMGGGLAFRTLKSGLVGFPAAYYLSGKNEYDARQGKQITGLQNFIRKHPALIGTLFTIIGNKAQSEYYDAISNSRKSLKLYKTAEFLLKVDSNIIQNIQKDLLEATHGR